MTARARLERIYPTRKPEIALSGPPGTLEKPRNRLALAPFLPLQFLDRPHNPLPDGTPVHVATLQHSVGVLGCLKVSVVNPYRLPDRIMTLSSGYTPMVENIAASTKSI